MIVDLISKFKESEFMTPEYSSEGSGGVDLRAYLPFETLMLSPGDSVMIDSGISVDMSKNPNIAAFVIARSGLGTLGVRSSSDRKGGAGVCLSNAVGLIDSDYHGEIKVAIVNMTKKNHLISHGDRIAQLFFQPIIKVTFNPVQWFESTTGRGKDGFGSSGVR